MSKLNAIVVALIGIDQKSQDLLTSIGKDVTAIGQKFNSVPASGKMPLDQWTADESTAWSSTAAPAAIRGGIRYFQRVIPIN